MKTNKFEINGREISDKNPPYIIAEISANHNGSIQRALDTIDAAKKSGADAVKIQTYTPDTLTIDVENSDFLIHEGLWKGRSLYDLYGEAYTPFEWHEKLFDHARQKGVTLFSSPFDETAVDLLESLKTPAFKIASFELVDLPLIEYVAKKRKPIFMSTGMASINEIKEAIKTAKENGAENIAIFHCISSYPAPLEQSNIHAIKKLKDEFNVEVGLSDHTIGNLASVVATSLGASVIEKHFTLSREEGGVDSTFSLEPSELKNLVNDTKLAHSALGMSNNIRASSERGNMVFRRSLYFVDDINEGEKITSKHIRRIRPGFGLEPKYYKQVLGSVCLKKAKKGDRVSFDHFKSGFDN